MECEGTAQDRSNDGWNFRVPSKAWDILTNCATHFRKDCVCIAYLQQHEM